MLPRMEPTVRIPSAASGMSACRRSWRIAAPRLQPVLDLASRGQGPVRANQQRHLGPDPQPHPVLAGMVDWSALLDNPDFMVEAQRVIADFDRYLAERGRPLVPPPARPSPRGPHRLFLRRVRAPRIARHLLRRPRRPRRRPHEVGQRHGAAPRGRRAAVSQRLLPPDDRCGRPPGASLPRLRPRTSPDHARARARG